MDWLINRSEWIVAALVVLFFWLPGAAITALSVRGMVRLTGNAPVLQGPKPSVARPAIAAGISLLGLAAGLLMLGLYAVGAGLGGYTPPLQTFLFNLSFLSPSALAGLALLSSLAWLALTLVRR